MDNDILEKKAFEAIHDLKSDVALLSGCVDRLSSIESVEGEISGKIERLGNNATTNLTDFQYASSLLHRISPEGE